MSPVKVVVLGSCMADMVARIERLPVPGETLFARSLEMSAGGKGANQAIAARRLGATEVTLIGRVGSDAYADLVLAALHGDGIDTRFLGVDRREGTGVAIPLVFDDGGNSIVSVPRANMRISVGDVEAAREAIAGASVLLLQFEVPMEANVVAAGIARAAGVTVILNAAPYVSPPPELMRLADVVVANEVEAAMLAPGQAANAEDQARALLSLGPRMAIVTLGAEGLVCATGSAVVRLPCFAVEAVDSVGAGDAFCGALAVGLAEGMEAGELLRFASAAGALAVTRPGAAASLPARAAVDALRAGEYDGGP